MAHSFVWFQWCQKPEFRVLVTPCHPLAFHEFEFILKLFCIYCLKLISGTHIFLGHPFESLHTFWGFSPEWSDRDKIHPLELGVGGSWTRCAMKGNLVRGSDFSPKSSLHFLAKARYLLLKTVNWVEYACKQSWG